MAMKPPAGLPPEDLAVLHDLARDVVVAIHQAGLPARVQEYVTEEPATAGVKVWIENADDNGGGIYLIWDPHPELNAASRRAVEAMDLSSPDLRFSAEVTEAMRIALTSILLAAGFAAVEPPDISGAQVLIRPPRY
jgi:hypothetical protein